MELRQLRYFIAVAERLSFSKAAEQLHVTVPPLSRQIRQLEEELDAQLFVRDRRHVVLTDAGQLFLREARLLLAQTEHACDSVRLAKNGEAGRVKIGIGLGLGERVGPVLVHHARRYPAVDVSCSAIYSIFQSEALVEGTIDVGFMRPPVDHIELTSEFLFDGRFAIHVSKDNPLAKRKSIHVVDLAGETLLVPKCSAPIGVYDKTIELCSKAGVPVKIVYMPTAPLPHGDLQTILLASRKGIFIMPDEPSCSPAAGSQVVAIPFDEPEAQTEVHVAWRKNEAAAAVLGFVDSVRRVFQLPSPASVCIARHPDPPVLRVSKPRSYQTS